MKRYCLALLSSLLFIITVSAQSSSVFDAAYFENNTEPPIKIGKGFHINDIYRQTRSCFTTETSNMSKLTAQQTGGKRTTIRMFYTKTNSEFNDLKRRGRSGKVSFLNLFSVGGQQLTEYSNTNVIDKERLVFTANVDFGVYTFDREPILTSEAKTLIAQDKLQEFVKMYGTHYISGIRKESNVTVILTKSRSTSNTNNNNSYTANAGVTVPVKGAGSFEVEDGSWVNEQLTSSGFDVRIEVNGPGVNQQLLQREIGSIITGSEDDKLQAISNILTGAIKELNDPTQAMVTQYYYTPYSLYGLEGIHWDQKRESYLTQINQAVIKVYAAKTKLQELINPSGKRQIENELRSNGVPQDYINRISNAYSNALPSLQELKNTAENNLQVLQAKYTACSDVYCKTQDDCCGNRNVVAEIAEDDIDDKIADAVSGIMAVAREVKKEMDKPECEKSNQGIIIIKNTSANPYSIYNGDNLLEVIPGGASRSYAANKGVHRIKAVQKSGFAFYATTNHRVATIERSCQKVTLTIGYED